ncbi:unnamed protein product [Vitrella brassicaformis CCMP3155]|uniref:Uncharacterized protein n=1 Tax=Vitrella brassicaformis (strain CCMP3155) TaxID=1169540 RepID=A0A0G4EC20_VITBC|nr:unnamed protein product [Vitrella brassicaformis CCMP3155]|eukprot:CEL93226.1 unnamed protein product [Vitrella brassicaformis CCMP3155]
MSTTRLVGLQQLKAQKTMDRLEDRSTQLEKEQLMRHHALQRRCRQLADETHELSAIVDRVASLRLFSLQVLERQHEKRYGKFWAPYQTHKDNRRREAYPSAEESQGLPEETPPIRPAARQAPEPLQPAEPPPSEAPEHYPLPVLPVIIREGIQSICGHDACRGIRNRLEMRQVKEARGGGSPRHKRRRPKSRKKARVVLPPLPKRAVSRREGLEQTADETPSTHLSVSGPGDWLVSKRLDGFSGDASRRIGESLATLSRLFD